MAQFSFDQHQNANCPWAKPLLTLGKMEIHLDAIALTP
jgi:hypothetical protein